MMSPAPPTTALDTITIVLADDHRMVRAALRLLLETQDDFEVVADVGDAAAALRSVGDRRPSVLVLDLNMPGELSGLEAVPRVGDLSPETAVVVLTMQHDPGFARRALRDGARAYVLKDSADEELVEAVRQAAAGDVYVARRLREAFAGAGSGVVEARPPASRSPGDRSVRAWAKGQRYAGSMDPDRARQLLALERERIEQGIADLDPEASPEQDESVEDGSQDLYQQEFDAGRARDLRDQLAAVERAEARLDDGTYGRSVDSGEPIPDARLEALPTAELTVEEQDRAGRP